MRKKLRFPTHLWLSLYRKSEHKTGGVANLNAVMLMVRELVLAELYVKSLKSHILTSLKGYNPTSIKLPKED